MAPLKMYADEEDDDFIRTISDTDTYHSQPEDDEKTLVQQSKKIVQNSKKRKRFGDDEEGTNLVSFDDPLKTSKKKKRKNQNAGSTPNGTDLAEDDITWTARGEDDGAMDSDFEFQIGNLDDGVVEELDSWGLDGSAVAPTERGRKKGVDIDEIIARRKGGSEQVADVDGNDRKGKIGLEDESSEESESEDNSEIGENEEDETLAPDAFGMGAESFDEEEDAEDGDGVETSEAELDEESIAEPMPHPDDSIGEASSSDEEGDINERAKREAFFAPEEEINKTVPKSKIPISRSFQNMSLSRPIMRGLAAVGFSEPTPIQTKTIPIALLGKDIVGGAVTGSGKTAAFILPILERLLYRPKKVPTSRVAILMPTRELAVQCFNVAEKLASFTDVNFCQLVGGFSLREQESVLKRRPDVIIATPGRFIDHMRNSASFTVETLEILVLDEADRMLEDGFAAELNEILTTIPKSRQTMLFSATMTDQVDKLIRVGLNKPVRLIIDARKQTVGTLTQEFVRLRPGREDKRLGYLLYLCQNVYTERVIIFFRQKKEAHHARIIFGLCGMKAAELHGSMSQEQVIHPFTFPHLLLHPPSHSNISIPANLLLHLLPHKRHHPPSRHRPRLPRPRHPQSLHRHQPRSPPIP